jgi:hypothetical protein
MSRITGNDAKGLMEAYGAVYQPKQLTEEQVWEGVEKWVNALVEEGYDLSDYTWEEMYEAYGYVVEQMAGEFPDLVTPVVTAGLGAATYLGGKVWDAAKKMFVSRSKTKPQEPDYGQTSFSASKETPAPEPSWTKEKPEVKTTSVPGQTVRGKKQGDTTSTPGASAQQPAPESPAKPARKPLEAKPKPETPKPVTQPAKEPPKVTQGAGATGGEAKPPKPPARKPTSRTDYLFGTTKKGFATRLGLGMPAAADLTNQIADPGSASDTLKTLSIIPGTAGNVLRTVSRINPNSSILRGIDTSGKNLQRFGQSLLDAGRGSKLPVYNSTDLFDLVKGYLLDEGYAATEEAAFAIMANMSEEWRQSIVEQLNPDAPGNTHSLADLYKAQEKWMRDQEKKKKEKEPKSGGSGAASQVKGV